MLNIPKVFISYSWSSSGHENWVLGLAEKLRGDGIDVILDKWDLGVGHDKYAFMERMVTDKDISKVIIISDKLYMEKANDRKGGVGTESQIISQEIYERVNQDKFIPVVVEYDEIFSPYLPVFLKGRKYIDLSPSANFDENYSWLLRCLFDMPQQVKPRLESPPKYIIEEFEKIKGLFKTEKIVDNKQSILSDKDYIELPDFDVINEKIDDMPIKTQVHQDILVTGNVSKESIKSLLSTQYDSIKRRKGFKGEWCQILNSE